MGKLALLFLAIPVAELFVLVQLGSSIGGGPTFLLVLASAVLGMLIARAEGLRVVAQTRQAIATGTMPSDGVLDGVLTLLACALLITPGVITDVLALALLVPWSRRFIAARVVARIESAVAEDKLRIVAAQARQVDPRRAAARPEPSTVIDTEGETVQVIDAESADVKPPPRLRS